MEKFKYESNRRDHLVFKDEEALILCTWGYTPTFIKKRKKGSAWLNGTSSAWKIGERALDSQMMRFNGKVAKQQNEANEIEKKEIDSFII